MTQEAYYKQEVDRLKDERDTLKADNEKLRKKLHEWNDYAQATYLYWKEWHESYEEKPSEVSGEGKIGLDIIGGGGKLGLAAEKPPEVSDEKSKEKP